MTLGAVVLCGGQSSRMGSPKAWLPFGDELLLQRVVRQVGRIASRVVVVSAAGQNLPTLPDDVTITSDALPGRGPLQGLAAGLSVLQNQVELAYVTATDAPFLAESWVRRLLERIGTADLAIPRVQESLHPLAALYRCRTVLPVIKTLLDTGPASVVRLTARLPTVVLSDGDLLDIDPQLRTVWNLNTKDDYRDALRISGLVPRFASQPGVDVDRCPKGKTASGDQA